MFNLFSTAKPSSSSSSSSSSFVECSSNNNNCDVKDDSNIGSTNNIIDDTITTPSADVKIAPVYSKGFPTDLFDLQVGSDMFHTTRQTLMRFAPHALSELAQQCGRGRFSVFVDQDSALFPRILQYLRSGHTHASFLDELSSTERWTLYEQVRDFYHIQPLLEQLEHHYFPKPLTESEIKERQTQLDWWRAPVHIIGSLFMKPAEVAATEKVIDDTIRSVAQDPLLFSTAEETTLAQKQANCERYDRNNYVNTKIFKLVLGGLINVGAQMVMNILRPKAKTDSETKESTTSDTATNTDNPKAEFHIDPNGFVHPSASAASPNTDETREDSTKSAVVESDSDSDAQ